MKSLPNTAQEVDLFGEKSTVDHFNLNINRLNSYAKLRLRPVFIVDAL